MLRRASFGLAVAGAIAAAVVSFAAPGEALGSAGEEASSSEESAEESAAAPRGVTARLLADVEAAAPGTRFTAGVEIAMEPGWHTYWENGGDAGLPTTIEWKLPDGVTASGILWPVPHRYAEEGDVVTFGYAQRVLLLSEIEIPATFSASSIDLAARVDWLQCKELCVPGGADVALTLPVAPAARPASGEMLTAFERARAELPVQATSLPGVLVHPFLSVDAVPAGGDAVLAIVFAGLEGALPESSVYFPRSSSEIWSRDGTFRSDGESIALLAPITIDPSVPPGSTLMLSAVCRIARASGPPWIVSVDVPVMVAAAGHTPVASSAPVFSPTSGGRFLAAISGAADPGEGSGAGKTAAPGLARFLLFAFLGGILLNAMPCVLPVVSLKILSLVSHANDEHGKLLRLGLSLAAGVLVSFLVLAGVVIALQSAGEHIGWGFQFQSPAFVAGLAVVIFVFSLSLLGVFEIHLPVGGIGGAHRRAHLDAFMNGVLTTVLATPCTAPMLGPAVGFAFTQPPIVIIAIFLSVGMGLMLPYLLLTMHPGWLRFVPKPGAWMVTFKQVMGFLLLATLLWLLSVFGAQTGAMGIVRLLAFLFALGILSWAHGRFVTLASSRGAQVTFWTIAACVIVFGYMRVLKDALALPDPGSELARPTAQLQSGDAGAITWDPFTRAALQTAVDSGSTVFLDFTAEWCWTCKVNERTVLADSEVEDLLLEYEVVTLKGDWTRRDPEITALLKEHGRAGVPFYAVYPAGNAGAVIVLPELINKKLVLDSLRKAGPSRTGRA